MAVFPGKLKLPILAILLAGICAHAAPPEGLEDFAILGGKKAGPSMTVLGGFHDPVWRSSYAETGGYLSTPVGGNHLTAGYRTSVQPTNNDRTAWFIRHDFRMFSAQSLSLKFIHEDWNYIATSKESIGGEYNLFAPIGKGQSGLMSAIGLYYRWMKQRWVEGREQPFNFNTPDQEGYVSLLLGMVKNFGSGYWTLDFNYRDTWSYYGFDNIGFEGTANFGKGGVLFRLYGGIRTSALFMGTGMVSDSYGGIGLIFH